MKAKIQRGWIYLVANIIPQEVCNSGLQTIRAGLRHYDFTLWENVIKFREKLPEACRQEFAVMVKERVSGSSALLSRTVSADA